MKRKAARTILNAELRDLQRSIEAMREMAKEVEDVAARMSAMARAEIDAANVAEVQLNRLHAKVRRIVQLKQRKAKR